MSELRISFFFTHLRCAANGSLHIPNPLIKLLFVHRRGTHGGENNRQGGGTGDRQTNQGGVFFGFLFFLQMPNYFFFTPTNQGKSLTCAEVSWRHGGDTVTTVMSSLKWFSWIRKKQNLTASPAPPSSPPPPRSSFSSSAIKIPKGSEEVWKRFGHFMVYCLENHSVLECRTGWKKLICSKAIWRGADFPLNMRRKKSLRSLQVFFCLGFFLFRVDMSGVE